MTPPGNKSKAPNNFIRLDPVKKVDYDSDTNLQGEEEFKHSTAMCDDNSRRAPNPFPDRGAEDALRALRVTRDDTGSLIILNP